MELNSDETLSTPCYIALQSQVQFLDSQSAQLKILLKAFQTNLNNLKSLLSRTKVRIKSLKKETTDCTTLLQSLPSTLSKSYSEEICRIKNPNTTLVNIAEKLLEILQQPDKSWKNFKILMKSNALLRHLMENARPIVIPSESLSEMVLIWTNYGATQGKLLKYSKGVGIIAEWVKSAVEYKVKQDLYEASMQEHSK